MDLKNEVETMTKWMNEDEDIAYYNQTAYIWDSSSRKILEYSLDGNWKNSYRFDYVAYSFSDSPRGSASRPSNLRGAVYLPGAFVGFLSI